MHEQQAFSKLQLISSFEKSEYQLADSVSGPERGQSARVSGVASPGNHAKTAIAIM